MHPAVAIVMVLGIILILLLPRKYVIVPFLCFAFLIPLGQMLVFGGLHLFLFRILLIFGCVRMFWMKLFAHTKLFGGRPEVLDTVFILWAIFRASAFLILFSFQSSALVNQGAFLLDVFGAYFFLRYLIQDDEDILRTVKALAGITIVMGACMLNEKLRSQNVFGYLGGFPITPLIRDGAIRARGTFSHPILAGCFGAVVLPLFYWLWQSAKAKGLAIAAIIGSCCIVFSSASSTPLTALAGGILAVCFWPMRKHMRLFRWGIALALVSLHLVMKAPVWFLIARVDLTGASSGYHRAMLVDTFIRHFTDWWLVGTNMNDTWGFDMWDLSNQFVAEGITGGLATFVCFITLIAISFKKIGLARKALEGDRNQEWFFWFLGAAMFANIMAYFGTSYYDHSQVSWFALLAMIAVATTSKIPLPAREHETVPSNSRPGYLSLARLGLTKNRLQR